MSTVHGYPVSVTWNGGRTGSGEAVAANSNTTFPLAVGTEYHGTGEGTNPEELLTAAVAGCCTITIGIMAEHRKLPLVSLNVTAEGEVEQQGVGLTFKKVILRPHLVLESDVDDAAMAAAEQLAHKADQYCPITNAVRDKVEIVVEVKVERA
jgi:peroxiredoxin-like protein